MRGFRKVGRIGPDHCIVFDEDAEVDDSDLIMCSPDILGERMRVGWWRARSIVRDRPLQPLHMFSWYVAGASAEDYLFVVTALGEDCFK